MSGKSVISRKENQLGLITINRPEKLNALDLLTLNELAEAFDAFDRDSSVSAVLFNGAGKAFIAGGDISDLNSRRGLAHYVEYAEVIQNVFRRIEVSEKPTIGAINGLALGGGAELMLCLDIRVMSSSASIGVPEIKLGLFPGAGGTQRLMRQIPLCRAKELMFTGDSITAEEAVSLGLANKVVPDNELTASCMALGEKICKHSAVALKLLKRTLSKGLDMPLASALAYEQAMVSLALETEDAKEGCNAFLEKRNAVFKDM